MLVLNAVEQRILEQARTMPLEEPPPPWIRASAVPVGGVLAGGWAQQDRLVLISPDGYSVTDPGTGRRLLRDHDAAQTYAARSGNNLTFVMPGVGERVPVFGVWGGDGVHVTDDGWEADVIAPWWPRQDTIIRTPFIPGSRLHGYLDRAHLLRLQLLDGWLKCGFSPSGMHLLILGSGGAEIFSRPRQPSSSST